MIYNKNDIKFNDTFSLKIDNELYPEYNGKYLVFNFIENIRNNKSDRLIFRVKITDFIPEAISVEDINVMEYIKIAINWLKDIENEEKLNSNEDRMVFEYQMEMVNTNDLDQFLDSLNYLGNYQLIPPVDEYIPLNDKDFSFCFANSIFDIVLDCYYSYNERNDKTIFDNHGNNY